MRNHAMEAGEWRILLVEDSPIAGAVVRGHLLEVARGAEVVQVTSLGDALAVLHESWDVVLLDLGLPDCEGVDAVGKVRALKPDLPIVVLTASDDPALAMRALDAQAQDYLVKRKLDPDTLIRAIRYAVGRHHAHRRSEELRVQLERSERLAAVGQLAAGVAHEINNPLAYVTANLDLLHRELARFAERGIDVDIDGMSGMVARARDGANRVSKIVRELGVFARTDSEDELTPVSLPVVIESALNMARTHIKHRAQVSQDLAPVPAVRAADGRLAQVFVNLLVNAAQAIEEGHVADNVITVRTYARDGHVFAEVVDTGRGIAQEHFPHLFDPFFTTKDVREGSGLGLSICRSIVESFGGTIEIESQLGQGTLVRIRLPVGVEPAARAHPPTPAKDAPTRRGRVLIVDDESMILRALTDMLSPPHDVVSVTSGEEARALLAGGETFDVVLCDVLMQQGTGIELYTWLESERPDLAAKVLFMSAGGISADARGFLASNQSRTVTKPFDLESLTRRIQGLLAER